MQVRLLDGRAFALFSQLASELVAGFAGGQIGELVAATEHLDHLRHLRIESRGHHLTSSTVGSEKGNFEPLRQTLRGARAGPPVERAGFGMLTSFAVTIPVSRTINYVRERRRHAPAVRSVIRRIASGPKKSSPTSCLAPAQRS